MVATIENRQFGKQFIFNELCNVTEKLKYTDRVEYCTAYLPKTLLYRFRSRLEKEYKVFGDTEGKWWLITKRF